MANERQRQCQCCGGTTFRFEQVTFNEQMYDAKEDEWAPSAFKFDQFFMVNCFCDTCGEVCDAVFADIFDFYDFPRQVDVEPLMFKEEAPDSLQE